MALMMREVYSALIGELRNDVRDSRNDIRILSNTVSHLIMEIRVFCGILITLVLSLGSGILWKVW